jgi:hypothetical protein
LGLEEAADLKAQCDPAAAACISKGKMNMEKIVELTQGITSQQQTLFMMAQNGREVQGYGLPSGRLVGRLRRSSFLLGQDRPRFRGDVGEPVCRRHALHRSREGHEHLDRSAFFAMVLVFLWLVEFCTLSGDVDESNDAIAEDIAKTTRAITMMIFK